MAQILTNLNNGLRDLDHQLLASTQLALKFKFLRFVRVCVNHYAWYNYVMKSVILYGSFISSNI